MPNLEELRNNKNVNHMPIVDAVINGKLPRLKLIHAFPLTEENYHLYVTCMVLMKHQVESLIVTDKRTINNINQRMRYDLHRGHYGITKLIDAITRFKRKERFNRLFNKLHQFPKLQELFVTTDTNDPIITIESVTEKCTSLHTLRFELARADDIPLETNDHSILTKYTPRSNIKASYGMEVPLYNSQFLSYIMHKYPQLQNLYLDDQIIKNGFKTLQKRIVNPFFAYLTKIDTVVLHELHLDYLDDFLVVIQCFWRDPSKPVAENVQIEFGNDLNNAVRLDIMKGNTHIEGGCTNIRNQGATRAIDQSKFIEEYG